MTKWWQWAVVALVGGFVISGLIPRSSGPMNWEGLGSVPVLHLGRVKPIDTVARATLLSFKGSQSLAGMTPVVHSPTEWLVTVMLYGTDDMPLFMVRQSEVLNALNQNPESKPVLSFKSLLPYLSVIDTAAQHANSKPSGMRTQADREWMRLRQNLSFYTQLKNTAQPEGVPSFSVYATRYQAILPTYRPHLMAHLSGESVDGGMGELVLYFKQFQHIANASAFRMCPPDSPNGVWKSVGDGYLVALKDPMPHPVAPLITAVLAAVDEQNPMAFNQAVTQWQQVAHRLIPTDTLKSRIECQLNQGDVMMKWLMVYGGVSCLVLIGWLWPTPWVFTLATRLAWLAWIGHTVSIAVRMALLGRPPVTNLYTSAVFVGWVAILLALWIERRSRMGLGTLVAGIVGFLTLLIAHHLSLQGDTMEMMQAVLDSNFWLATHVVTICIGYGAVFLAGALANVGIVRLVIGRMDPTMKTSLTRMVYGTLCVGLLFSFIGTVLGGIWADQSWGRFWGWDPKENGAFIICVWVAAVLHARWGGMIRERGLWVMAVFGNVVTAFSWFGVNMLGVGLHSYGFMDQAFFWLMVFNATQLIVMWLAFWPRLFTR